MASVYCLPNVIGLRQLSHRPESRGRFRRILSRSPKGDAFKGLHMCSTCDYSEECQR